MFDYIKKYNDLPKELKDEVGSRSAVSAINELEKKYGISLASLVMKIMVKEIAFGNLAKYLSSEFSLDEIKSEALAEEMKKKVFKGLGKYLGIAEPVEFRDELGGDVFIAKYENHLPMESKSAKKEAFIAASSSPRNQDSGTRTIQAEKPREIKSSTFFFDPEDEEEIREFSKKMDLEGDGKKLEEKTDSDLAEILNIIDVNFGSEFLSARFKQILRTYLRGIRDSVDTKAALEKSFEMGGLGFDGESSEKVLRAADSVSSSRKNNNAAQNYRPFKIVVPEDSMKAAGIRDVDYDLSSLAAKKAGENNRLQKKEESNNENANKKTAKPAEGPAKNDGRKFSLGDYGNFKEGDKAAKSEAKQDRSLQEFGPRASQETGGKVRMEDVKFVPLKNARLEPKVMTPIDELSFLDLVNFRRLGQQDPLRSIEKIKAKINLLEEEGYARKLEAIKSWRSSPVNKLYLKIGEESISKNEPVDVIMEERKSKGEEYLTSFEFDAIMDLNRELRF